jgi:hypothetical protein
MAAGFNARDRDLGDILQSILNRLTKVEKPISIHVGPIGGAIGTTPGYTLSVNAAGQLIATSDNGTVSIVALP